MNDTPQVSELEDLVQRYRVCREVFPEYMFVEGQKRQIGFTLELIGTHPPEVQHPEPGCSECVKMFHALEAIAGWITPKEHRDSQYDILAYDQAIHRSHRRGGRPDVVLSMHIGHRSGFGPVDACEERCLKEMEQKLGELGVAHESWADFKKTG